MRNSGFIASRLYDSLFFIFSPILAFAIVLLLSEWTWIGQRQLILGVEQNPITFFIVVWTHAHLFAVFFRSHANTKIFAKHRFAFVAVPILLFVGFMASDWLIITGLLVSGLWAVYHLGMQNFGLGRIYDARCGNPPEMGRTLDYWLHQFINLGPFIAGLCLIPSLAPVRLYRELGWNAPAEWLRTYGPIHSAFSGYLLAAGLLFLAYYSYAYGRFTRQGYRLCPQKIALLVSTGSVSVVAWGFLPAWKAFFVMNFFHSLQYLALVWWTERGNIRRLTGLQNVVGGSLLAFSAFAMTVLVVGVGCQIYGDDYSAIRWAASIALVIALMHYWYDGFIWSVSKREV